MQNHKLVPNTQLSFDMPILTLDVQPRSGRLCRESPLDNGESGGVRLCGRANPAKHEGWLVGLETPPRAPVVKGNRGINAQTVGSTGNEMTGTEGGLIPFMGYSPVVTYL